MSEHHNTILKTVVCHWEYSAVPEYSFICSGPNQLICTGVANMWSALVHNSSPWYTNSTHQLQEWGNSVKKTLDFDVLYLQGTWPCEVFHGVLAKRKQGLCAVLEGHVIVLPLQWLTRFFTWLFGSSVFHDSGTKILNMRKEWVWLKDLVKSWRDGSAIKSTCCSCRGPKFKA